MKKKGVPVDIEKLSHGLKTTFLGVAEVFESIGAEETPGFGVVEEEKTGEETAAADETETTETVTADDSAPAQEETAVEKSATAEPTTGESSDKPAETETDIEPETKDESAPVPQKTTLTVDDLIKVAAQKIKLKKGNSDKIGALVKAYGQTTLKDLPPEKYEAFMTDLAQI